MINLRNCLFTLLALTIVIVQPAKADAEATAEPLRVLFFGDSLTAGYGVGKEKGFPALVQGLADTAGCSTHIINAGLPGETTAAGVRRVSWILRQPVDVFVLQLGGNDGLRGVPLSETERNLRTILDTVRVKDPQARLVVAGVRIPPNLGPDYTTGFQAIFPRVAADYDAVLIPRLLDNVAGNKELMRDPNHPNEEGHRIVAQTVFAAMRPTLCGDDSTGAAQDLQRRHSGDAATAGQADQDGQ